MRIFLNSQDHLSMLVSQSGTKSSLTLYAFISKFLTILYRFISSILLCILLSISKTTFSSMPSPRKDFYLQPARMLLFQLPKCLLNTLNVSLERTLDLNIIVFQQHHFLGTLHLYFHYFNIFFRSPHAKCT